MFDSGYSPRYETEPAFPPFPQLPHPQFVARLSPEDVDAMAGEAVRHNTRALRYVIWTSAAMYTVVTALWVSTDGVAGFLTTAPAAITLAIFALISRRLVRSARATRTGLDAAEFVYATAFYPTGVDYAAHDTVFCRIRYSQIRRVTILTSAILVHSHQRTALVMPLAVVNQDAIDLVRARGVTVRGTLPLTRLAAHPLPPGPH